MRASDFFSIIKLHNHDDRCWAVVDASGAIAVEGGRLVMRMTKAEAEEIARLKNVTETFRAATGSRSAHGKRPGRPFERPAPGTR